MQRSPKTVKGCVRLAPFSLFAAASARNRYIRIASDGNTTHTQLQHETRVDILLARGSSLAREMRREGIVRHWTCKKDVGHSGCYVQLFRGRRKENNLFCELGFGRREAKKEKETGRLCPRALASHLYIRNFYAHTTLPLSPAARGSKETLKTTRFDGGANAERGELIEGGIARFSKPDALVHY